ncbi:MAG: hypothetical protein OES47_10735 [Acidobacteriota bacterium]|nr:hypothetical protein [Acidobacteriota bacterium]
MIDEAIGKILGMAMAYVASAAGMLVAYINYRKRIVKAERVMTGTAWTVIGASILAVVAGAVLVVRLAAVPEASSEAAGTAETSEATVEALQVEPEPAVETVAKTSPPPESNRWPWIGIALPAAIFLFATVVTAALHRHFTTHGH